MTESGNRISLNIFSLLTSSLALCFTLRSMLAQENIYLQASQSLPLTSTSLWVALALSFRRSHDKQANLGDLPGHLGICILMLCLAGGKLIQPKTWLYKEVISAEHCTPPWGKRQFCKCLSRYTCFPEIQRYLSSVRRNKSIKNGALLSLQLEQREGCGASFGHVEIRPCLLDANCKMKVFGWCYKAASETLRICCWLVSRNWDLNNFTKAE